MVVQKVGLMADLKVVRTVYLLVVQKVDLKADLKVGLMAD
jgi:hypothetical protein